MDQTQTHLELRSPVAAFSASVKGALQAGQLTLLYVIAQFCLLLLWAFVGNLYQTFQVDSTLSLAVNLFFVFLVFVFNALSMVVFIRKHQNMTMTFRAVFGEYTWRKMVALAIFLLLYGIAVAVGSVFFVVPGLILLIWWMLGAYVLVLEDTSVRQAFVQSRALARHYAWPLLGYTVFFVFIFLLVSLLTLIPYAGTLSATLLSLLLTPVWAFYFGFAYHDLREIKQANAAARPHVSVLRKLFLGISAVLVLLVFSLVTAVGNYLSDILSRAS